MLQNPYYLGIVTYNGVQYPGRHERLVPDPLFEEVQAVFEKRSRGKEKPVKLTHYLKGLVRCGLCRSRLGIVRSRGKSGAHYPYFFCLGRHGHRKNGCSLPFLPIDQVEAKVEAMWTLLRLPAKQVERVRAEVTDLIELASGQHEADLAAQRLRLERLDADEAKLLQAHYAEAISLTLMQKEQQRLRSERADAERVIGAVSMEYAAMQRALDDALGRIENCDEIYRAGSPRVRRELGFAIFDCIYVGEEAEIVGTDLADLFAQLMHEDLQSRLAAERKAVATGTLGTFASPPTEGGAAVGRVVVSNVRSGRWPGKRQTPPGLPDGV